MTARCSRHPLYAQALARMTSVVGSVGGLTQGSVKG